MDKTENFLRHLEPLQSALEAFARRVIFDRNAVEDVLQSAIGTAFRDFHLYVEGTNFRAWIFRYVHLQVLNHNREQSRIERAPRADDLAVEQAWESALDEWAFQTLLDDPEPVLERCDAALSEAVRALSPLERDVLLLKAIGEFKYREIAEILHIPIGTVMSSLGRCRVRLRAGLVEYGGEHGLLRREKER